MCNCNLFFETNENSESRSKAVEHFSYGVKLCNNSVNYDLSAQMSQLSVTGY